MRISDWSSDVGSSDLILQIAKELLAGVEALRRGKAHVVGIKGVGHDEVRAVRSRDPVRQVVGVGVGGVDEAAFLRHQVEGVDRIAPGIPAERPLAGGVAVFTLVCAYTVLRSLREAAADRKSTSLNYSH